MGEASERKFGNRLSFPMCGADIDDWMAALLRTGSYIPLAQFGFKHEDWGMAAVNNAPVVNDRKKQHISYIQAGSFGRFLLEEFGVEKMKAFYRRADGKQRPWQEVFGLTLDELESRWLENVKQRGIERQAAVSELVAYWLHDPQSAGNRLKADRGGK